MSEGFCGSGVPPRFEGHHGNGFAAPSQSRTSIANQAYFITASVNERSPVFLNPQAARIVLDALKWLENSGRMVLQAAVVMPDHLHFAAALNQGTLPELMHSLKSYTAKRINVLLNRQGAFWQAQYHDHALRQEEVLNEVVLYMLHNPVRAGLVEDFHEYPFWYCRWKV
jgi:REP element-mobilizing transposase RayT